MQSIKHKSKHIFGVLLTVCMVLSLISAFSVIALAESANYVYATLTVTMPAGGAYPDYYVSVPASDIDKYSAVVDYWYDCDEQVIMEATDTFVEGGYYYAEIIITPESPYTIDTRSITINGQRFPFDYGWEGPTPDSYVVYREFTASIPVVATYTIAFDVNGGSSVPTQTVFSGNKAVKPEDPTKEGFNFVGWFTDKALTTAFDFNANISSSLTLYAMWMAIEVEPITPVMPVNPFTDVKGTDWFIDAVILVYDRGLMNGTSTNPMLFSPAMTLTRGMVVTVLYRLEGSGVSDQGSGDDGYDSPFTDVPDGAYYADAVKWAYHNGIVSGYGNGKFGPEDNVTREQMATMLFNYQLFSEKIPPDVLEDGEFNDNDSVSDWAKNAVNGLAMQGVITGKPGNLFDPKGNATRAEFATVLMRFVKSAI